MQSAVTLNAVWCQCLFTCQYSLKTTAYKHDYFKATDDHSKMWPTGIPKFSVTADWHCSSIHDLHYGGYIMPTWTLPIWVVGNVKFDA